MDKNNLNRSRQLNPCDLQFWKSRGYKKRPANWKKILVDIGYYNPKKDETSRINSKNILIRSRQLNPHDHLYWKSRGYSERPANWKEILADLGLYDLKKDKINALRSRQLNPCDILFWKSRGYQARPSNWKDILRTQG